MNRIKFPKKLLVSSRIVNFHKFSRNQQKFYLQFVHKLIKIHTHSKKNRVIICICGPTGSGKSVLGVLAKHIAQQMNLPFRFELISQDAYHYPNKYLLSHFDKGQSLKDFKGRYDTYDTIKLKKHLERFVGGSSVTFPIYSRKIHEPIAKGITVNEKNVLLLIEGIWLLHGKDSWQKMSKLYDFSFFIKANKKKVKDRVIQRHFNGGKTLAEAKRHYNESDAINFNLIMQSKSKADTILQPYYELK